MIIGIAGLAGSGKSEIAHTLTVDRGFKRFPFAGPLKAMLEAAGFTHPQLWGDEKAVPLPEFGGKTTREIMQTLGTEWAREMVDNEFWITIWKRHVKSYLTTKSLGARHIVVDDVRFPNEVKAIQNLGGQVWRVNRPGVVPMGHASEKHIRLLPVDASIHNNADLHALRQATLGMLECA